MNFLTDSIIQSQVSVTQVFVVLLVSVILGFSVSFVYRKTFKGVSYSASFSSSLILLLVISSAVMLVIGSNLARAFGLVGALSIIRFRTAIKDPRDLSFVFLSLVLGVAVGTLNYHIAIIVGLIVLALIYFLDRTKHGSFVDNNYFLTLEMRRPDFNDEVVKDTLLKYAKDLSLTSINNVGESASLRAVYKINVSLKDTDSLVAELSKVRGVTGISLISSDNYVMY